MYTKTVGVIGLGRVGLPLSLVLADNGYTVLGIDNDHKKRSLLEKKKMPFREEGALVLLKKHTGKRFIFGTLSDLTRCSIVVICIGTFLKDDFTPDVTALYQLLDDIVPVLNNNVLLVLRSTIHPKGTEKIASYIAKKTDKKIQIVYAPERIAEGFAVRELYSLPQIIGGFDKTAAKRAAVLFQSFAPQILHTDPLSAELAKLVLNTYRYSKFALANELMMIVDFYGRDIHSVLKLANSNYERGGIPQPGLAAGPCLVKDSFFLRHNTPFNTLITGSHVINNSVTDYLINKISGRITMKGKKIAVLGLAFKRNIDDDRGSLSLDLVKQLQKDGCRVSVHDPFLAKTDLSDVLNNASVVIFAVDHSVYKRFTVKSLRRYIGKTSYVCDIWNVLGTNKIFFELS